MTTPMNYDGFDKEQWRALYPVNETPISPATLKQIKAFNDRISTQDVTDIYLPLVQYIQLRLESFHRWQNQKATFLGQPTRKVPFIIGIAGSVAVGKSTTARVLAELCQQGLPGGKVELITTDGFLYPNATLKEKDILNRKGFPESYDMEALISFLNDVKAGKTAKSPRYSHSVYDIIPDEFDTIDSPDVLIVEGINTLQLPSNEQIYVSDYTDFSIYVDADPDLIEKWFLDRFEALLDLAKDIPDNYYHKYAVGDRQQALMDAKKVWRDIDLVNLEEYILPTKNRASLIIHKTDHHLIDQLLLRKY